MTARTVLFPLLATAAAMLLVAGCGGGSEQGPAPASLTDPGSAPTSTPWDEPPQPIILEPRALTPQSQGEQTPEGGGSVEVTAVEPFQVTSEDSTNLRAGPSTDDAVVGTLEAGDKATVTGQASGEAVTEGNDAWYQLEDGSFVYSGAVQEVTAGQ